MTQWIDVYNNKDGSYMHSIIHTDENMADYVASLTPSQHVKLVEATTDALILSTVGNFLDFLVHRELLEKSFLPILACKQQGIFPTKPVTVYNRFEQDVSHL